MSSWSVNGLARLNTEDVDGFTSGSFSRRDRVSCTEGSAPRRDAAVVLHPRCSDYVVADLERRCQRSSVAVLDDRMTACRARRTPLEMTDGLDFTES